MSIKSTRVSPMGPKLVKRAVFAVARQARRRPTGQTRSFRHGHQGQTFTHITPELDKACTTPKVKSTLLTVTCSEVYLGSVPAKATTYSRGGQGRKKCQECKRGELDQSKGKQVGGICDRLLTTV